jgi:galactose mutarotase-like enzyme
MLQATANETVTLRDDDTLVELVPARGAIVTRFRVGPRELLYLDEATLRDPAKNVRGGIPLLFPSPGKLEGDRFIRGGPMKQHGFARDMAWEVTDVGTGDAAFARLLLTSNERTRASYPWDFSVKLTFSLKKSKLRLALSVANTGAQTMPFAFGIHPYFHVSDKASARIPSRATRAFDNVTKKVVPFHGFDLTAPEVDLHLLDHGSSAATLFWGDGGDGGDGRALTVRGSPEFGRWVVWTVAGKDFVCLEPWTAPGNALNTGESLLEVMPGGSRDLWLELDAASS